MSLRIKDHKIKKIRLISYPRDIRYIAIDGSGTYAVNQQKLAPKIGAMMGTNKFTCFVLGSDNNQSAISTAIAETRMFVNWKPMPLWKNHFRAFFYPLPSLDDVVGGFGRSPETCVESAPRFYPYIKEGVTSAKYHDLLCGAKVSFRIEPYNWGSHLPAKMLQDAESRVQGLLRGTRVGLTTIPTEPMALKVFKNWFPTILDSGMFGVEATVISDESMSAGKTKTEKDEIILKGLIGTGTAFIWDSSLPGYKDVWKILSEQSRLIGVNAVENDIIAWRKPRTFWLKKVDIQVSVIQIRRLIKQTLTDPNSKFVDADIDENTPKVLVVIAKVSRRIFNQAIEESLLPSNIIPLFMPTKSLKITVVLFYPLRGRIRSIEKHFGLERYNPPAPYSLPNTIIKKSIQHTKPTIEKTASVACVSPEFLLNGA